MSDNNHSELLSAWLEGALTDNQRNEFEKLCSENAEFAARVETANNVSMLAQDYHSDPVPEWHRENTFRGTSQSKWWQWSGLPALSMACSFVAIFMVVSGFQIQKGDGVVTIGFNQGLDQVQVEKLLEQRMADYQQEQALVLDDYAQSLRQQQIDASTQLTNYLLASSRQERREDFGEFIKFINDQRSEDQIFYARQLNQLQQQLYANPAEPNWSVDAEPSNIND